jgi:hypothetical protein
VAVVLIQTFWKFVRKVVQIISRSSSKMGHVRSKTRSQKLKIEKNLYTVVATVLIQIFWKFVKKVVLMISRSSSNMGRLQSKITKNWSHCPNMENLFNKLEVTFLLNYHQTWPGCLSKILLGCGWWVRGAIQGHHGPLVMKKFTIIHCMTFNMKKTCSCEWKSIRYTCGS